MTGCLCTISGPILKKDLIPISLGSKYDGGNTVTVRCREEEFVLQDSINWPPGHTDTDSAGIIPIHQISL